VTGRLLKKTLKKTDQSCLSAFGAWDTVAEVHHAKLLAEILPPGSPTFLSAADAFEQAGKTDRGIPVSYPVGDNQSGFFGVVSDMETECLVSIGTSGQFTLFSPRAYSIPSMELRPFLGLGYLQVGATLCAGKSYENLKKFLLSVLQYAGLYEKDDNFVYAMMKTAAESGDETPLTINTTLKGTRSDAALRGSITGIGLDNFSLGNLVRGTIGGIVSELSQFSRDLGTEFHSIKKIIVTGNVVKENPLFVHILERQFNLDVVVADADASIGAALIGAISAGIIEADERVPLIKKIRTNKYSKMKETADSK
jgi:sedoheptulokinase